MPKKDRASSIREWQESSGDPCGTTPARKLHTFYPTDGPVNAQGTGQMSSGCLRTEAPSLASLIREREDILGFCAKEIL